jgi:gamma-glutamylputrescine oxidase
MPLFDTDRDLTRHSYYDATAPRTQRFVGLQGDIGECDVAVVGGGFAGLSAAIDLADRGFSVVVLEAREVGSGASGRNGGQAIHGLACDQDEIEGQLGLDAARRVWDMTIEALDLIRQRCVRFAIDCDWRDGFLGLAVNERKSRELRRWRDRMAETYAYPLEWIAAEAMPRWIASPRYVGGIHDPRSGHLHPLKFSLGLARAAASLGVRIFEGSTVKAIVHGPVATLRCEHGALRARYVLLAGNVYLDGLAPKIERRIMPVGTYIVASERLDPVLAASLIPSGSAACDTNFVLDYFRTTVDHRVLYGGRVSYTTATPRNLDASMQTRMVRTFPQLAGTGIDYSWGGFVDISMNRAPDFGRMPADGTRAPNVYYVQGFSGHGVALAGLAGKLVAEAMVGDAARFDTFARLKHRPFPGGKLFRMPALVLGTTYYRLKDLL